MEAESGRHSTGGSVDQILLTSGAVCTVAFLISSNLRSWIVFMLAHIPVMQASMPRNQLRLAVNQIHALLQNPGSFLSTHFIFSRQTSASPLSPEAASYPRSQ